MEEAAVNIQKNFDKLEEEQAQKIEAILATINSLSAVNELAHLELTLELLAEISSDFDAVNEDNLAEYLEAFIATTVESVEDVNNVIAATNETVNILNLDKKTKKYY